MSNKEKLINLLKEYGVPEIYYSKGGDLNAESPNITFLLIGHYDSKFVHGIYSIYTDDENPNEDQSMCVCEIEEDDPLLYGFKLDCPEVLYADIP